MGKNWLTCVSVSCLSPGRDKKQQVGFCFIFLYHAYNSWIDDYEYIIKIDNSLILVLVLSRNRRKIRRNGLENKRVESQLNILWRRLHRLTLHLHLLLGRLLHLLLRCRILLLSLCCLHPLLHPLLLLFRHLQVINAMVIPQKQRLDKLWLLHQLLQPRQLWWLHMLQPRLCVSPRPQHIKFLNQRRNLPQSKSKMRTDVTRYTYKSFIPLFLLLS